MQTLVTYPDGPERPGESFDCRDGFVARVVSAVAERNVPDAREAARRLNAFDDMLEALATTAGNIRSLGPSGALAPVPEPYRVWLERIEAAVALAEGRT